VDDPALWEKIEDTLEDRLENRRYLIICKISKQQKYFKIICMKW
jgi:hypothetical protein